MASRFSRRRFLKSAAAVTAASTAWLSIPKRVLGANERLNIAGIGANGQAKSDLSNLKHENIVALADIDEKRLGEGVAELSPNARTFSDYREMLEKMDKQIDAVLVAIPDHSHAYASLAAMRMGKPVYCEKPLAHNVREVRLMREEAKKRKLVTQMGTQIHGGENYRRVVELVKGGAIGAVKEVHVWVGTKYAPGNLPKDRPEIPKHVNWDLWLGPALSMPYSPAFHPFSWRGWWNFGGGTLSDMACHHMDIAHWALDLLAPETVEAEGPAVHPDSCPPWLKVKYHHAAKGDRPAVDVIWYSTEKKWPDFPQLKGEKLPTKWGNTIFVGEKGLLLTDYGQHLLLPEQDFKAYKKPEATIPKSIGHYREWAEACKGNGKTLCHFEYSGPLAEAVQLGNVAYRVGKKITWDAENMKAVGCPEADQYIRREYRKGWEL